MKLLVLLLVVGGVSKGGKLVVKGANATLADKADGSGKKTKLEAGDEVTWNGADDKNKSMQAVEYKGRRGFVHVTQLTTQKDSGETGGSVPLKAQKGNPASEKATAALVELEASSAQAKAKVPDHLKLTGLQEAK